MYKDAIDYELLTRSVYQALLKADGLETIAVQHNITVAGRSGVEHQIDVSWEFVQVGIRHLVLIECKNYASNLTLEKARNFFGVLHDIGNCRGVMVTRTGYQEGAAAFCKYYGIGLKLLRKPTDDDWVGRTRKIVVNIVPRVPVSTENRPITAELYLRPSSDEQEQRLNAATNLNPSLVAVGPSLMFLDAAGSPITEEMRWWIPRQLNVLDYADGGPYKKPVELRNHYVSVDLGRGLELVQAIGIVLYFFVETLESTEIITDAATLVDAVLKDFESGEWEHVYRAPSS